MINGPWDYVEDPSDSLRVVVVGAVSDHHTSAQIFSGEDAHHFTGKTTPLPGRFSLDFAALSCAAPAPSGVFQVNNVDKTLIKQVIDDRKGYQKGIRRYTISLPKPCSYKVHPNASAWSRVDPNTTNPPATEGYYPIWLELHYKVSAVAAASFKGDSDDGTISYNDKISFINTSSGVIPGISIVMAAPAQDSDSECDSNSLESFVQSNRLFGLKLEAQFPMLDSNGNQTRQYSANSRCIGRMVLAHMHSVQTARDTLVRIEQLEGYLADSAKFPGLDGQTTLKEIRRSVGELFGEKVPEEIQNELKAAQQLLNEVQAKKEGGTGVNAEQVLEKTEEAIGIMSVGSGDCHKSQISINSVVP